MHPDGLAPDGPAAGAGCPHRPSVARVIDQARPYRGPFPMRRPADVDVL
jgi:hypothetical protein